MKMKKYLAGLAVIGVSAILTGCGSQADCASSDVQETYLGMVGHLKDEGAAEILKSSVFKGIVTKDIDKNTGYRTCAAKIVMENEAGARELNIRYQIEQVESGEANFQLYADRNDLRSIAYTANTLASESRADKKTKELIDAAAANPYVLATEQDARDAGLAVGHRFLGDRVDVSSARTTSLDIDGDGVMEFLTAMKVNYTSGDSNWLAFVSYQSPKGSGETNSVEFVGEGALELLGMEPSSYEMQGKSLVIKMADGSEKSLAYHTSTEAYQAYIKANGGISSAPVTPSTMSVAATRTTATTTTPSAGVVEAAIAERTKQDGGSEYTEGRKSVEGDLTGDGTPDVAVLYSLEGAGGGNGSVSYLAAFAREAGQLKLADTISISGAAQGISLEDGTVHLKLLVHGPDDPDCCPTGEEDVVYALKEGKWQEAQAQL